ncbi:MAG: hypothetical protein ACRDZ1_00975 [Acidimicrobiia bacterium]
MNDFLDQVEAAANDGRLYYIALLGALTVPDICGALEAKDGQATGDRFKAWYDAHVAPQQKFLTGEDCYRFRCSFLHQGSTQHPKSGYSRILFVEPGAASNVVLHMNVMMDALNIDARLFCLEVVDAARHWLTGVVGTEPYETNLNAFVRRYPDGLPPYIGGVSVIS